MITKDKIAAKLRERLDRKCTAIEITHWAKGLMFDYYENRLNYAPEEKETIERAILRIANSSTNYRTFLFDSEILKMIGQLDEPINYHPPHPELYSISIIIGQQSSLRSKQAVNLIAEKLSEEKHLTVRQQGSGMVITADHMSEAEIHQLAGLLQAYSYIMSLQDYRV